MRRMLLVLAAAALMAMLMGAMAAPALAQALVQRGFVGPNPPAKLLIVTTPSGNQNISTHFKPTERQGGGGGGAEHFSGGPGEVVPFHPDFLGSGFLVGKKGKSVLTPSGNMNANIHNK
jgi:hypothetical protein